MYTMGQPFSCSGTLPLSLRERVKTFRSEASSDRDLMRAQLGRAATSGEVLNFLSEGNFDRDFMRAQLGRAETAEELLNSASPPKSPSRVTGRVAQNKPRTPPFPKNVQRRKQGGTTQPRNRIDMPQPRPNKTEASDEEKVRTRRYDMTVQNTEPALRITTDPLHGTSPQAVCDSFSMRFFCFSSRRKRGEGASDSKRHASRMEPCDGL